MHRFLTAFLVLSTLAMTQNVVAVTPSPFAASDAARAGVGAAPTPSLERALTNAVVDREVPTPGTMLLLVTGLAGLSAVGSRPRPRPVPND